jgi:hypothetical protein
VQQCNAILRKLWFIFSRHVLFPNRVGILYALREIYRRLSVLEAFEDMIIKLKLPFAMEIIELAAWGIWIVKNNKIFQDQNVNFNS